MTEDKVNSIQQQIAALCIDRHACNRRMTKLRALLANEFARRNGWRRSKAWDALHKRWRCDAPVDHVELWRTADRGFALSSHVYGFDEEGSFWRRLYDDFARENPHLVYEVVTSFPSWWFPARTTLIVWQERELA